MNLCKCGCGHVCKNEYVNVGHSRRGKIPWNKGLNRQNNEIVKDVSIKLKGRVPWNQGLTKENDARMLKASKNMKNNGGWNRGLTVEADERLRPQQKMMLNQHWALGYKHTEEALKKIRFTALKYGEQSRQNIIRLLKEGKIGWGLIDSHKESYPEKVFREFIESLGAVKGIDFIQEYRIGTYSLDFAYPCEKRYIEIDGSQHNTPEAIEHDRKREEWLENQGWTGMRIPVEKLYKIIKIKG